ncbi:hypothetical protein M2152_001996 [Microbacteriaceae bacterium SG_E_30_P1]|uniref:Uncharacterized protein n=1 Tax=Antiquaquibacter oligotrophicus TaxID=2880260 RepID=A0ABT6KP93_9MICO|nr:hypothetical protein [Antiquaquibacter oligotrophicus]MDH6181814.1 hypothetical protein [Antiquaquibacter oligotrophicus]UDF12507.1 hypothetical protein LH407_10125 [Antiquaquibacter oligotrophicus]
MPQVPATPAAVKNMRLQIGTDTFELHANNVLWSKNTQQVQWQGGTPDASYSDLSEDTHACAINLVNDYQNEDSLFNFLIDHAGETAAISYRPDAEEDFVQTATITLVAPNTGGGMRAFHEQTVTCPSTPPVRTFTPPA